MSYLKHQALTLLLNRFKTSAEGWRSGKSDNDVVQSLGSAKGKGVGSFSEVGGGGAEAYTLKIMTVREAHITKAKSLAARVQGPLKGPGSSGILDAL